MKKSMIAAAVVATAFAATANAGYFNITGASYGNGGSNTISGSGFVGGAGTMNNNTSYLLDGSQAVGGGVTDVTALDANSTGILNAALGGTTASVITLQYFSFDGAGGVGYFGFRVVNNSGSQFNFNFAAQSQNPVANFGSAGLLSTGDVGSYNSGTGVMSGVTSVGAGQTFYGVFGGLNPGHLLDIDVARNVSETATFNVEYLSFSGTTGSVIGSGSGAQSSSLSFATYAVPVPAPALLAGAGLVGAAALRRRMAKKA